ncbi:MAG TPA: hypothetical protein VE863_07265 [Pyrinomonadaceae bacterium]|jgi:ABC-type multidrug transport system permease subunit|nr:hypothetical protein [Pyrinomonadaceae bacterium]
MRWKLIILASLIGAIIGFGLWCAITIAFFGSAINLARHDWILLASVLLPLGFAIFGGVFVYRHTARRRKVQAVTTAILSLILTIVGYCVADVVDHDRFVIPRTSEVRHGR